MSNRELKALEEEARRRGETLEANTRSSRTRSGQTHAVGESEGSQSTTTQQGDQAPSHTSPGAHTEIESSDSLDLGVLEQALQELFAPFETPGSARATAATDTEAEKTVRFAPTHKSTPDQNIEKIARQFQKGNMATNAPSDTDTQSVQQLQNEMLTRRSQLVDECLTYQADVNLLTEKLEKGQDFTHQDLEDGVLITNTCKAIQQKVRKLDAYLLPRLDAEARREFIRKDDKYRKVKGKMSALDILIDESHWVNDTLNGTETQKGQEDEEVLETGPIGEAQTLGTTAGAGAEGGVTRDRLQRTLVQQVTPAHLPRLPELKLSVFRGNPTEWPRFHQRFLTMIDSRTDISDLEKLDYLLGALEGEPKRMVEAYDYKPSSYKPALKALERRVKKQRNNATTWINDIKALKAPRPNEADDYFLLCDGIRRNINRLQSETTYDIEEQYNIDQLMEIIEAKLHPVVKERWRQHISSYWKLQRPSLRKNKVFEFIEYFEELANIKDDILPPQQIVTYESPRPKPPSRKPIVKKEKVFAINTTNNNQPRQQEQNQYMATSGQRGKKQAYRAEDPYPCTYCKGPHPPRQCNLKWNHDVWKLLISEKICFVCLCKGHNRKNCRAKKKCTYPDCQYYHHPLLHGIPHIPGRARHHQESKRATHNSMLTNVQCYHQWSTVEVSSTAVQHSTDEDNERAGRKSRAKSDVDSANLPVVIVPTGPTLSEELTALIDSGSSHSFVSHKALTLFKSVKILDSKVKLSIAKLNNSVEEVPTKLIQITLKQGNNNLIFEAFLVHNISRIATPPLPKHIRYNIKNITMNHTANLHKSIDILFGIGDMYKVLTGRVKRISPTFNLLETIWGYIPAGFANTHGKVQCYNTITTEALSRQVEMTWQMENLDMILNKSDKPMTIDEKFALDQLRSTLEYDEKTNRYTVGLVFKSGPREISNNYDSALARLNSLFRKLSKQPVILDAYIKEFKSLIDNGVYEEINDPKACEYNRQIYYLPHREVYDPSKQGHKCRFVSRCKLPLQTNKKKSQR